MRAELRLSESHSYSSITSRLVQDQSGSIYRGQTADSTPGNTPCSQTSLIRYLTPAKKGKWKFPGVTHTTHCSALFVSDITSPDTIPERNPVTGSLANSCCCLCVNNLSSFTIWRAM